MSKGTILDRLAGAMKTLGKREGKALTPRQRVAAAQRWNSLADIGMDESAKRYNRFIDANKYDMTITRDGEQKLRKEAEDAHRMMRDLGISSTTYPFGSGWSEYADNPFLSDNIDKYQEQSEFLDWCRDNRLEPNGRSLKQFRWETYKTLPYRQRQWIANKDAIKSYLGPEMYGYPEAELDGIKTLDELENYLQEAHPEDDWPRHYPMYDSPVFESMDEFPDDFDYMWRY